MQVTQDRALRQDQRERSAREQAALFPTRLALARWTAGGDLPHLPATAAPAARAAWLAQATAGFQAWLDRGGFAQHDRLTAPAPQAGPVRRP